jgi:hypothetical protein
MHDKVDWLAENERVDGAALVIFLCRWRQICKYLQPMGSKRERQKKIYQKLLSNIGSLDTLTKYTLLTLLRQLSFGIYR